MNIIRKKIGIIGGGQLGKATGIFYSGFDDAEDYFELAKQLEDRK